MARDIRPLLKSRALKSLEEYWRTKKQGRIAPARRDIDPVEMRAYLPQVFLIDITRHPLRFWFRLVGTGVAEGYGEDLTGKRLDQVDLNDVQQHIIEDYKAVVIDAHPVYSRYEYTKRDHKRLEYERLLLPLSTDGETVDMILGAAVLLSDIDGAGAAMALDTASDRHR